MIIKIKYVSTIPMNNVAVGKNENGIVIILSGIKGDACPAILAIIIKATIKVKASVNKAMRLENKIHFPVKFARLRYKG
jgi:hypothetical protein